MLRLGSNKGYAGFRSKAAVRCDNAILITPRLTSGERPGVRPAPLKGGRRRGSDRLKLIFTRSPHVSGEFEVLFVVDRCMI